MSQIESFTLTDEFVDDWAPLRERATLNILWDAWFTHTHNRPSIDQKIAIENSRDKYADAVGQLSAISVESALYSFEKDGTLTPSRLDILALAETTQVLRNVADGMGASFGQRWRNNGSFRLPRLLGIKDRTVQDEIHRPLHLDNYWQEAKNERELPATNIVAISGIAKVAAVRTTTKAMKDITDNFVREFDADHSKATSLITGLEPVF